MNWISRLERKYGRFCIPNLISLIVGGQILVYAIELFVNQFVSSYLGLSRSALLRPDQLDLVLVPCTAFDAACRRVGMGKGYYDRYLPRCTRAVKVGVAFEAQRVEAAAVDAHDQRLDGFVTEGGLYFGTDTTEL